MTRKDLMVRQGEPNVPARNRSYYERRVVPSADIIEGTDEFIVRVDMPGVDKSNITLKVDSDKLKVQGSTGDYHAGNASFIRHETKPTCYEREFYLGNGVDRSKIHAEYSFGILTITLQKSEESKPKHISIR
jgi:HSP20 family protein